jgi:NADH:ubiquinone oxidoreductase subunit 2 (subunit N)
LVVVAVGPTIPRVVLLGFFFRASFYLWSVVTIKEVVFFRSNLTVGLFLVALKGLLVLLLFLVVVYFISLFRFSERRVMSCSLNPRRASNQGLGLVLFLLGLPPLPLFFLKVMVIRILVRRGVSLLLVLVLVFLALAIVAYFSFFSSIFLSFPTSLHSSIPPFVYPLMGLRLVLIVV